MSQEYAEKRIKDALKQAGGNAGRAKQQIIAWCFEDSKLLHALAKPHLNGIVAYQVERVQSGRNVSKEQPERNTPQVPDIKDEELGMEVLRAVAAQDAIVFGRENTGLPQMRRSKASKQHIDAIRMLAGKGKPQDKP